MPVSLPVLPVLLYTDHFYTATEADEEFAPYVENACWALQNNVKALKPQDLIDPHLEAGVEAIYTAIKAKGLEVEYIPPSADFLDKWRAHIITLVHSSSPHSAI